MPDCRFNLRELVDALARTDQSFFFKFERTALRLRAEVERNLQAIVFFHFVAAQEHHRIPVDDKLYITVKLYVIEDSRKH